jgi:hypothetical protein
MKTNLRGIKITYDEYENFPGFKKIHFETVPITLDDVYHKHVYPWQYGYPLKSMIEQIKTHHDRCGSEWNVRTFAQYQETDIAALIAVFCNTLRDAKDMSVIDNLLHTNNEFHSHFTGGSHDASKDYEAEGFPKYFDLIKKHIYFVKDGITIDDLLSASKEILSKKWTNDTILEILSGFNFNELRNVIKNGSGNLGKKKKELLKCYDDRHYLNLPKLLTIEDLMKFEKQMVYVAFGTDIYFRTTDTLKKILDEENRIVFRNTTPNELNIHITKYPHHMEYIVDKKDDFCLYPNFYHFNNPDDTFDCDEYHRSNVESLKSIYREFSKKWNKRENNTYIINLSYEELKEFLDKEECLIYFPSLQYNLYESYNIQVHTQQLGEYKREKIKINATIKTHPSRVKGLLTWEMDHKYILHNNLTINDFQYILKKFNKPFSGSNKSAVLDRVCDLLVEEYENYKDFISQYLKENPYTFLNIDDMHTMKYIVKANKNIYDSIMEYSPPRIPFKFSSDYKYNQLENSFYNTVISLYLIMHIRGNCILNPNNVHELYTERELSVKLVNSEMTIRGVFSPIL